MKAQKSILEGKLVFIEGNEFVENLIDFDGGISEVWLSKKIKELYGH
jgi:hypothetical protein